VPIRGWCTIQAPVGLIVGGFNLIEGIAALAQKSYVDPDGRPDLHALDGGR
jgi:hypothetical protein